LIDRVFDLMMVWRLFICFGRKLGALERSAKFSSENEQISQANS